MDKALAGQRALVTAGASGLGRAIARRFAAEGARIFVCDVDEKALSAFLAENPGSSGILADVADPAQVDHLFDAVAASLGGLDILVNNAGIAGPTR
ncbi:MAG: SDR family NAD(P)-dependent oxidoreductase, partial [Alphaproteobacteria bacterium]